MCETQQFGIQKEEKTGPPPEQHSSINHYGSVPSLLLNLFVIWLFSTVLMPFAKRDASNNSCNSIRDAPLVTTTCACSRARNSSDRLRVVLGRTGKSGLATLALLTGAVRARCLATTCFSGLEDMTVSSSKTMQNHQSVNIVESDYSPLGGSYTSERHRRSNGEKM